MIKIKIHRDRCAQFPNKSETYYEMSIFEWGPLPILGGETVHDMYGYLPIREDVSGSSLMIEMTSFAQ
jgi:hypothetical protein